MYPDGRTTYCMFVDRLFYCDIFVIFRTVDLMNTTECKFIMDNNRSFLTSKKCDEYI